MEIVWLGHSCFRLRAREATLVTDPCPPATGYNIGKVNADVVTISHYHEAHSYVKAISGSPVVLDAPGEYEVHGAFITGIATFHDDKQGAVSGKNNVFVLDLEGLRVCHLGDLGHTPTAEQVEEMSGVDVVLVPVGGGATMGGKVAAEVVALLEPRLVIPMHFKTEAAAYDLEPMDRFLKEMGAKITEPQPRLQLTRSGLPHEAHVVLLDHKR